MSVEDQVRQLAERAKRASAVLGTASTQERDDALLAMARELRVHTEEIVEANGRDMAAAREAGTSDALLDRLMLDAGRVDAMAGALEELVDLPDPLRENPGVLDFAQRHRPQARQRAPRRRGRGVRGPSERHGRRGGHLPEVGQRRSSCAAEASRRLRTRRLRGFSPMPSRPPGCPPTRCAPSPRPIARRPMPSCSFTVSSTCSSARRRGPDSPLRRMLEGAGDRDGNRQLPRVRA